MKDSLQKLGNFCMVAFALLPFIHACSNAEDKQQDVATRGEITILSDESFQPIVEIEKFTFQSLYPYAKINVSYQPEASIIRGFLEGKAETIVTGRPLDQNEISFIKSKGYSVQQTPVAMDAILVLANKSFPDSVFTPAEIKDLVSGNKVKWSELSKTISPDNITVVFDQSNSSNFAYMQKHLGASGVNASLFAAGSTAKVISYINEHPNAIGIIGWSWISDEDDAKAKTLLNTVKIMAIKRHQYSFIPTVESVIDSLYPYYRAIYVINKGARAGLGAGFSSFIASDRGQRIILKAGIVPITVPGREIELK